MKIGVFDSGLGGLAIALAIMRKLPQYDYLYLGDTKRVPYGNRSQQVIHEYTEEALDYLFERGCQLIIVACSTASAEALRHHQQQYLPKKYPDRRVLGVLIPLVEAASKFHERGPIGVIATASTVESGSFERELLRLQPMVRVIQKPTPLLVPLVENDGLKYVEAILGDYLLSLKDIGSLILGCTHYCLIKEQVRKLSGVPVISPDEVVPEKLGDYLRRHPEIESKLSTAGNREFHVTDLTKPYDDFAYRLAGEKLNLEKVAL